MAVQGGLGDFSSFDKVDKWLADLPAKAAEGAEKALIELGLAVFRASLGLAPIDTGIMRGSANFKVTGKGFRTVFWIIYPTHYAIWVHEDLTKYHAPPTQAKFVEVPLKQAAPLAAKLIGRKVMFSITGPSFSTFGSISE